MLKPTLFAAALVAAVPAFAADTPASAPPETRIRDMGRYLEAVVDPRHGVYIRGYTGQWYYARMLDDCPRLQPGARLRFIPSPGGYFDRDSALRADGWRCLVSSVVESAGPPRHGRRAT